MVRGVGSRYYMALNYMALLRKELCIIWLFCGESFASYDSSVVGLGKSVERCTVAHHCGEANNVEVGRVQ